MYHLVLLNRFPQKVYYYDLLSGVLGTAAITSSTELIHLIIKSQKDIQFNTFRIKACTFWKHDLNCDWKMNSADRFFYSTIYIYYIGHTVLHIVCSEIISVWNTYLLSYLVNLLIQDLQITANYKVNLHTIHSSVQPIQWQHSYKDYLLTRL